MGIRIKGQDIQDKIKKSKVRVNIIEKEEDVVTLLVSCCKVQIKDIVHSVEKLNLCLQ